MRKEMFYELVEAGQRNNLDTLLMNSVGLSTGMADDWFTFLAKYDMCKGIDVYVGYVNAALTKPGLSRFIKSEQIRKQMDLTHNEKTILSGVEKLPIMYLLQEIAQKEIRKASGF